MEQGLDKCDVATISEEVLQNAVVKAINQVLGNRDSMMPTLQKNIEMVIAQDKNVMIEDIDARLKTLQKELVKQVSDKQNYNEAADEIYRLRELRQDVLSDKVERENRKKRIGEMGTFLHTQTEKIEVYDEQLVRWLIAKITAYDDKLTVEFKSGVETDVGI